MAMSVRANHDRCAIDDRGSRIGDGDPILLAVFVCAVVTGFIAGRLTPLLPVVYFLNVSNNLIEADRSPIPGRLLALLREFGPLSRIELARRSGLSPTTITRAVSELMDDGAVEEGATTRAGLGRPAIPVALNTRSHHVVGAQIGVGVVRVGMVNVLGTMVASSTFDYDVSLPAVEVVDQTAAAVRALVSSVDRVVGVGVAVPGPVDSAGRRILLPINLAWRDVPVAELLERSLSLPVVAEHNVRSMALAEARYGVGRTQSSIGFVYLGTGLGAGLVVDGKPFAAGVHGAIELGHLHVVDDGQSCVCGGVGCLETLVSEAALRGQLQRAGVTAGDRHPLVELFLATADHPLLRPIMDTILTKLATGLSTVVNLLNPGLLLLGGALAEIPEPILLDLTARTRRAVFPLVRETVDIRASSLGMGAGVLGGAAVALDHFFYRS